MRDKDEQHEKVVANLKLIMITNEETLKELHSKTISAAEDAAKESLRDAESKYRHELSRLREDWTASEKDLSEQHRKVVESLRNAFNEAEEKHQSEIAALKQGCVKVEEKLSEQARKDVELVKLDLAATEEGAKRNLKENELHYKAAMDSLRQEMLNNESALNARHKAALATQQDSHDHVVDGL